MTKRAGFLQEWIKRIRLRGKWYVITCSAILGVTLAYHKVTPAIIFIAVLLIGCALWKKRYPLSIYVLVVIIFFCYFHFIESLNITSLSKSANQFPAKIITLPEIDGDHISFQIRLHNDERVQLSYYLKDKRELQNVLKLKTGMDCLFRGDLNKPSAAGNFYGFDYRNYLHSQSVHWILSPESISPASCRNNPSLYERLLQWRQYSIRFIQQTFPSQIGGISAALLFGERSGVESSVLTSYQSLGIIHILAVSGMHVTLVTGAVYLLFIRIGVTKERALEVLFAILPLYIVITGATPSIVRAGLTGMAVLLALRFRRTLHPLDGISIVCLAMLLYDPYSLFQAGFQLSFSVSFALIASASLIQNRYYHSLSRMAAVTVVAQLSALPFILYHFYEISFLSLPMNIVFIPFISLIVLPIAFIAYLLYLTIPVLGEMIALSLAWLVGYAHDFLLLVRNLPFGMLTFGKPSWIMIVLLFLAIAYFFLMWERGKGWHRWLKSCSVLIFVLLIQWYGPYFSGDGAVTILDVGQGDSILIELPHREAVYLIDAGGKIEFEKEQWRERQRPFNVGRDIVLHELKARGIRHIDRLILTHGHADHIGGARALVRGIDIKEILYGKITTEMQKQLLHRAQENGSRIRKVKRGVYWKAGSSSFAVVSPVGSESKSNEASVVITATIGGLKWLFTGDLEEEGERRFVRDYPGFDVDILKVGHHGSNTSTTERLLQSIQPEIALISAGKHNIYGHPSMEVIERLEQHNITILRTDEHGAVRFRFGDGDKVFEWVRKNR